MSEEHVCETCGKVYKSRSGLWKHQKSLGHGKFEEDTIQVEESQSPTEESVSPISDRSPPPPVDEPVGDTSSTFEWMDFDFGSTETTDTIPAPLKSIVKPMPGDGGKLTKAQQKALESQNKGILKMMLTNIIIYHIMHFFMPYF